MTLRRAIRRKEIVFVINDSVVDDVLVSKILLNIPKNYRIGIDMSKVSAVKSNLLIENLLNNKIKLFNLQDEVLAYLSLILKDGFLKSYVNYLDFKEDKREFIKRHFLVA